MSTTEKFRKFTNSHPEAVPGCLAAAYQLSQDQDAADLARYGCDRTIAPYKCADGEPEIWTAVVECTGCDDCGATWELFDLYRDRPAAIAHAKAGDGGYELDWLLVRWIVPAVTGCEEERRELLGQNYKCDVLFGDTDIDEPNPFWIIVEN